jgi:serpin B
MAAADFTDMMEPVDGDGNQIWLGRVLHKTHIEVDRVGTRAAAVTAIEVEAEDSCEEYEEPVMIILDRPFIYGIIDNETGLPVFLGCVNSL